MIDLFSFNYKHRQPVSSGDKDETKYFNEMIAIYILVI